MSRSKASEDPLAVLYASVGVFLGCLLVVGFVIGTAARKVASVFRR